MYNAFTRVNERQERKEKKEMKNTDTNYMINVLIRLFNEREKESVMSMDYAKLTQDILWLENALIARGVDTVAILLPLAEARCGMVDSGWRPWAVC